MINGVCLVGEDCGNCGSSRSSGLSIPDDVGEGDGLPSARYSNEDSIQTDHSSLALMTDDSVSLLFRYYLNFDYP